MEDGGELYILRSGIGGYYDTVQIYEPGEITYYGDFAVRVTTSGGNQYDMSEMSPEIWASLTPGQRAEITSGNRVDTNYYYYLRGEKYDGDLIPTLSDIGYDYVYLNPDGSSLYFQGTSIAYVSNADLGENEIYGDFSELMEEIGTRQAAVGDLIQDAVSAVALGDAESAVKSFQALSDNGTDFAAISRFCSELARNGVLDIGIDMTFGYLRLSDEEMVQLEMFLYNLQ